jgi:hypothetical protein
MRPSGLVLGLAVFLFFVRFLNVNLPAGWLHPLLGLGDMSAARPRERTRGAKDEG